MQFQGFDWLSGHGLCSCIKFTKKKHAHPIIILKTMIFSMHTLHNHIENKLKRYKTGLREVFL